MATKILYFLNTTAATPNWFGLMQDGGSAPTTALSTAGWTVAKNSPPLYFRGRWGATGLATVSQTTSYIASTSGPAKGTGSGTTTSGDSFITPAAYLGTFAAGAWTLTLGLRPTTATPVGTIRMRVWASVNADGTSARELTSGALAGLTVTMSSTTTTYTPTLTWSPAAITLNNEFMFFQIEWQETTAGGSNSTGLGLYLGATCAITTTDFQPTITGTFASTEVGDTAAVTGIVGRLGSLAATEAGDTAAVTGIAGLLGPLASTETGDTAAAVGAITNAKYLYVLATDAVAPNYWGNLQDGGSPPTITRSKYGFLPAATPLSTPFYRGMLGATQPNPTGIATSHVDAATRPVPGTGTGVG